MTEGPTPTPVRTLGKNAKLQAQREANKLCERGDSADSDR
ncbi:hypothetical protein chiPu_0023504, partial [Chiloscyllium punctatum]|nr:hypothetical protein [Chiloscyllium punctatum]